MKQIGGDGGIKRLPGRKPKAIKGGRQTSQLRSAPLIIIKKKMPTINDAEPSK